MTMRAFNHCSPIQNDFQHPIAAHEDRHQTDATEDWRRLVGEAVPPALTGMLLDGALAYERQCQRHGGLTLQQMKLLERLARSSAEEGDEAKACSPKQRAALQPKDRLPFAVGTEFIREWQGRDHVVVMASDGLMWSGETYGSLSAVAGAITGTRWNGRRFFGLSKRGGSS